MSKIKIETELRRPINKIASCLKETKIERKDYREKKPNHFKVWEGTKWGYYRSL